MATLCQNCSEPLHTYHSKLFCCSSCAAAYNNRSRVNKKIAANKDLIEDLMSKGTSIQSIRKRVGVSTDTFKRAYPDYGGNQGNSAEKQRIGKIKSKSRRETIFESIQQTGSSMLESGAYNQKVWLKRYLIDRDGAKCCQCGWGEAHPTTGNIMIELDHIDGNNNNNTLDNVRLLCPNCHSLTPTYRRVTRQ